MEAQRTLGDREGKRSKPRSGSQLAVGASYAAVSIYPQPARLFGIHDRSAGKHTVEADAILRGEAQLHWV